MGLETGTYINDLVTTNPAATDQVAQGDDHLRFLKTVLKATLPNASKPFYFPDFVSKTANYTILSTDQNKLFSGDASGGAFSLTLPTLAAGDAGWSVLIFKSDSGANAVTIVGTINGGTNIALSQQYLAVLVEWTGTAWRAFALPAVSSAGALVVAALTLTGLLDLSAVTDRLKLPNGTTAQRPGSPANGDFRFNSTLNIIEYYNGGWRQPGLPKGYISGFIVSNGTDTTNDYDVTAGKCRDSTDSVDIIVTARTGKQLDASWAVGSTAGLRSSSGLADGTWHLFAIAKADGTSDIFAHDAVDPTAVLPSGYLYFRLFFSNLRESSANVQIIHEGNRVLRAVPKTSVDVNPASASAVTRSLHVPQGRKMQALVHITQRLQSGATVTGINGLYTSLEQPDTAPTVSLHDVHNFSSVSNASGIEKIIRTNTSGQIRTRLDSSAPDVTLVIVTLGWYDDRGVND